MSFWVPILLTLKNQYRIPVNHGKICPRYRIFLLLLLCRIPYMKVKYLSSLSLSFTLCKMKHIRTCHRIKWTGRVYIFKIWPQYTSCYMLIYDVILPFKITHKYVGLWPLLLILAGLLSSWINTIWWKWHCTVASDWVFITSLFLTFIIIAVWTYKILNCSIDKWPKDTEILSARLQMNSYYWNNSTIKGLFDTWS